MENLGKIKPQSVLAPGCSSLMCRIIRRSRERPESHWLYFKDNSPTQASASWNPENLVGNYLLTLNKSINAIGRDRERDRKPSLQAGL
jgi:hypothetical protein